MKKRGVAPNVCPVLCRIKIEFKIKYFSHTLFNYNIITTCLILSGLNLCQKNKVRREQEPSELWCWILVSSGLQRRASLDWNSSDISSTSSIRCSRHLESFFFYVSLAISQDYFCVLGPTVYQQNITLQHTNIKKSVIPLT